MKLNGLPLKMVQITIYKDRENRIGVFQAYLEKAQSITNTNQSFDLINVDISFFLDGEIELPKGFLIKYKNSIYQGLSVEAFDQFGFAYTEIKGSFYGGDDDFTK